jgi:hypothetical protein
VIHSLADWYPLSVRFYKWGYSWLEMKELYVAKSKEYADKKQIDFQFLIDLAKAALGGGGGSDNDNYGLDTGDGLDDMTEEQETEMRLVLGDDFDTLYGN